MFIKYITNIENQILSRENYTINVVLLINDYLFYEFIHFCR